MTMSYDVAHEYLIMNLCTDSFTLKFKYIYLKAQTCNEHVINLGNVKIEE